MGTFSKNCEKTQCELESEASRSNQIICDKIYKNSTQNFNSSLSSYFSVQTRTHIRIVRIRVGKCIFALLSLLFSISYFAINITFVKKVLYTFHTFSTLSLSQTHSLCLYLSISLFCSLVAVFFLIWSKKITATNQNKFIAMRMNSFAIV